VSDWLPHTGECIDDMRTSDDLPDEFYDLFVVDPRHRPVGTVPLHRLVRSVRSVKVGEIIDSEVQPVPVTMDQEDVAFLFKQHDLTSTSSKRRRKRISCIWAWSARATSIRRCWIPPSAAFAGWA
jgi:magnesium transporter